MSDIHSTAGCPVCARLTRLLATTLAAAMAFIAAWFLVRRLAGGFGTAPTGLALLATAIVLAACSILVRRLCRLDAQFTGSNLGRAVWLAPAVAWIMLGLAMATFASSGIGLAVFWLAFSLIETEAWLGEARTVLSPWLAMPVPAFVPQQSAVQREPVTAPQPVAVAGEAATEMPDDVSLQLTRQQTSRGELIHGAARAIFEPGQKIVSVHVSFGEPLARAPEVLAESRSDIDVEIECAQALAHGVRFDLRLRRPAAERTCVVFDFEADAGAAESEAA